MRAAFGASTMPAPTGSKRSVRSMSVTCAPSVDSSTALERPASPPPITMTFAPAMKTPNGHEARTRYRTNIRKYSPGLRSRRQASCKSATKCRPGNDRAAAANHETSGICAAIRAARLQADCAKIRANVPQQARATVKKGFSPPVCPRRTACARDARTRESRASHACATRLRRCLCGWLA